MLKSISIKNYRNISNLKSEIAEKSNLIIAPNGTGKTNFLEAVHFLTFGESFRPLDSNTELIGPDDVFCKVGIMWDLDNTEVVLSQLENKIVRTISLNHKKTIISKITSRFPIILFAPHSVDLVLGEPSTRRKDLDEFLSIVVPEYKYNINKYKILLKNRNAVLKKIREGKMPDSLLDYWTSEIVKVSELIYQERFNYFQEIAKFIIKSFEDLYFNEDKEHTLEVEYSANIPVAPEDFARTLADKFAHNRDKEIIVGKTLYGIHKDDFSLIFDEANLRFKGSRGQQRIGTLILKIAQIEYFFFKFNKFPLLLLDDLMSELDNVNRQRVADFLTRKQLQFILTTADEKEIPGNLLESAYKIILPSLN